MSHQSDQSTPKSADEATQANRFTDVLLSNTSHELRTPLTAILGFTAVLQDELPERYQEFLDPIALNGHRLLHTLNAILDLARLHAGMITVHPSPLDVSEVVSGVVQGFAAQARQKGVLLHLVPTREPVRAKLDPELLRRIISYLVDNAVKFTGEGGTVTVTVERLGGLVRVHVRDTGIGIDERFMPHLFDEFRQESTGLTRSHEGSGLGLAITARLVVLMGGRICVQSQKGRGSNFSVCFHALAAQNGTFSSEGDRSALPRHG